MHIVFSLCVSVLSVRSFVSFGLIAIGLVYVEASRPASAQYQQSCGYDYFGGYRCSDNTGYSVRVQPTWGLYGGGVEAQDNYGNRCQRYREPLTGQIVTQCN